MNWERAEPGPANPLAWSVPIFRLGGIRFRLHFTFLLYGLVVLLRAGFGPQSGDLALDIGVAAPALGALLLLVLLREMLRAFVVRAAGGACDGVILWPLGSLQGIDPAPGWRAAMVAAVAGLAVSAVLLAAGGIALGTTTGDWSDAVLANPLSAAWLRNPHPWWVELLWIAHWTNIQFTALVLLPMLPLDGGRIVGAILVRKRGEYETPRLVALFTLGVAGVLAILAIVRDMGTLLTVAIACAGFAALELWRLRAGDRVASDQGQWSAHVRRAREEAQAERVERAEHAAAEAARAATAAAREAARVQEEAIERELDRILEKIAREGKEQLTRKERAALEQATERRRKRGPGSGGADAPR